jgi:hypothetical protein
MRFSAIWISCLLVQVLPGRAIAQESSFRELTRARSAQSALGELPVRRFLARHGTASEVTRQGLITALGLVPQPGWKVTRSPTDPVATVITAAPDFHLEVASGGSQGHYRARALVASGSRAPTQRRPTLSELEPRARAFVSERLGSIIRLGPGEALEAWAVSHEVKGVGQVGGGQSSELVASTVTFTRAIGGVAVLGPSSKVHVSYAPDGRLVGVEYDWPELVPLDEEPTASMDQVRMRIETIQRARVGQAIESSVECGYFTQGDGASASLHPACLAGYRIERAGRHENWTDVVPLARVLRVDPAWAEAVLLRAAGERSH